MRFKFLRSWQYVLDTDKFTLNGKPIQSEDIAWFISHYSIKHPDDAIAKKAVALWCYSDRSGQDNIKGIES